MTDVGAFGLETLSASRSSPVVPAPVRQGMLTMRPWWAMTSGWKSHGIAAWVPKAAAVTGIYQSAEGGPLPP